ncbi:MAG: D-TA family PLP-dependent enzyme [Flavisolibacter sp.]
MKDDKEEWYIINRINDLDSPALAIYEERVKYNIEKAIEIVGDVQRLRPHIKTSKSKEAILLMKKAGITKFKCATIAEADLLGMTGVKDVLLAYQPTGPKLTRFISVIKDFTQTSFACLVDNMASANEISNVAELNYLQIKVYIDVNVGMNRTGIKLGKDAINLFLYCSQLNGIHPVGFHIYDGHIHDADLFIRKQKINTTIEEINGMKKELRSKGFKDLIIVAGGTPTFPAYAEYKEVECSPGTFIYWDEGYKENFKEQGFLPAAVVISRIISIPERDLLTIDLGHKSIASENSITKRVVFINAPDLVPVSHSEEHMVLRSQGAHSFKIGDVLYGIPYHICPTIALYERASIIKKGQIITEWKNEARDRLIEH